MRTPSARTRCRISAAVVVAGALLAGSRARAVAPSPTDLGWLRNQCGDGALLYWSSGSKELRLTELSTGGTSYISGNVANGQSFEFSADSSKFVWIAGTTLKGRMRKGDMTVHTVATGVDPVGGVHWVSDTEVVVVKSGAWRRTSIDGQSSTSVSALNALGTGGSECDVKLTRNGIWCYVTGETWKTSQGRSGSTGGTCSCSFSPDVNGGISVTGLHHEHKECSMTQVISGAPTGTLQWVYDYTGDKGFDNHRWSSNNKNFVACQDEKYLYMVIMKVGGTYCTRMGSSGSGEMYGDFTVGDGSGDPWPGTVTEPEISLSPTSLTFGAVQGGSNPSSKSVSVNNTGGGTLADVSTNVSYAQGSGWLTVVRSGSGNSQSLANTVGVSGLSAGTYGATVTVSASGATNSPTYTVAFTVSAAPTLTTITVTPASEVVAPSGTASFTADAKDQGGSAIAAVISWSVSAGGSMSPTSSGSAVTQHSSTFTSSGTEGTFTVKASSGGVEGTATVTVASATGLHLKVNCGPNSYTPAGWEQDDSYAQGGTDFTFSDTFDTSGVTHAAPAEVYKTCRHRVKGVEIGYSYLFGSIPDGDYTVRLHFGDAYGPRSIDVLIEGAEVISDLDIATEAGGTCKALAKDVQVTVSDGDGLTIELTDDRASPGDVFVNGIEIIGTGVTPNNQQPTVDAGADQSGMVGSPVFLMGTAADDGLPGGALQTTWSVLTGPPGAAFDDAGALETSVIFTQAGSYVLQLTADDGELTATDTVSISISDLPSVTLTSPADDEIWYVGTTRRIRWTTVNVDDVEINYSTDGSTFDNIVGSVRSTAAQWADYPWLVPDEPSENCIMHIRDYIDDTVADTAPFKLRAIQDTDGDGMDDDWETLMFGDLTHDETTDTDLDGKTDYEEFMAGTDPLADESGTAPVSVEFGPEADTYVYLSNPDTNYGDSTEIAAGGPTNTRDAFIRFNVAIPSGATVIDARLALVVSNSSSESGGVLKLFAPTEGQWDETAPTWNAPLAGADASGDLASLGPVDAGSTHEFTGLKAVVTGAGRFTFVIRSSSADGVAYRSKEGGAAVAPVLRVSYRTSGSSDDDDSSMFGCRASAGGSHVALFAVVAGLVLLALGLRACVARNRAGPT